MIAVSTALTKTVQTRDVSNTLLKQGANETRRTAKLNNPGVPLIGRLPAVLPLNRIYFIDPLAMPIFGEFSAQPGAHDVAHLGAGDRLAAEGEDVGAVMFA